MSNSIHKDQFAELFLSSTPLLDVRSPTEFARGAFPGAINLPILTDEERARVGTVYKQSGQQAAIELGHSLVTGEEKLRRLRRWQDFLIAQPNAALYCFRGGLRSKTAAQWLQQAGFTPPVIAGGYKGLRQFLITQIEDFSQHCQIVIIAGKTGCGKTHVLNQLPNSIDLEGLAAHRGSAFGRRVESQPSQINFENMLAIALLQKSFAAGDKVFLEDESRAIGSLSVPLCVFNKMLQAPIAVIEASPDARVDIILTDYIVENFRDFKNRAQEQDPQPANYQQQFSQYLIDSLFRIRKRLGSERFTEIKADMDTALHQQFSNQGFESHRVWIKKLLLEYYDPMYDYQLGKKMHRVVFRGSKEEFSAWSSHFHGIPGDRKLSQSVHGNISI